jgi:hypothetical protein
MNGLLDKLGQTWPAKMAQGLLDAARLPGQVAGGILNVPPSQPGMWSDEDEAKSQATNQTMMNRAADLGGAVMGGSYAAPAMQSATGMGIRAYHGSPHDFDRFDLSKIGTGEGAQAYGHGLYFAEKEGVARSYKNSLSQSVEAKTQIPENEMKLAQVASGFGGGTVEGALGVLGRASQHGIPPELAASVAARFKNGELIIPGRMYEVNINAKPEQFLDWDKKIRDMSPVMQERLSKLGLDINGPDQGLIGSQVINRHVDAGGSAAASNRLNEAGIPGIKYLDQGSRAAGDGSRNYVVFDDKLIDILRKYGMTGLLGGGAAGMGLGGEAQAAP